MKGKDDPPKKNDIPLTKPTQTDQHWRPKEQTSSHRQIAYVSQ